MKEKPVAFDVLVEGTVQRVGFRRFAERLAKQFHISGYVQNKPDGTVNIFVQGDKDKVDGFISRINNAPEPIAVERLDKKESKPRPVIKRFQVKMGSIAAEINEGLGAMESQFGDYSEEFRGFTSEFRDYGGEFRDFSERTDDNFKGLDTKYGEISTKLTQILEELRTENRDSINSLNKSVVALLQAVEKFSK
ncbi:MAG: acylphosphatase [Nitrososphaerales archaeon]